MIKAVFDTNIYISAIFWRGKPYKLMQAAINRKFILVSSQPILNELSERLREKFSVPADKTDKYLNFLAQLAYLVKPAENVHIVKEDPQDDKIIATALAGKADFIVTGDKHLLKLAKVSSIEIVKAADFIDKIG